MSLNDIHSVVGISIAITGNILINVALNIQRLAHKRMSKRRRRSSDETHAPIPNTDLESSVYGTEGGGNLYPSTSTRSKSHNGDTVNYLNDSLWWIGITLMTVGEAGNFLAYGLAPASVVSPLGVFALVSNCVVAPLFFGERIYRRTIYGVLLAVIGILFIVLSAEARQGSGSLPVPSDPLEFILDALNQLSFRIYLMISGSLIVFLVFYTRRLNAYVSGASFLFSNILLVALFGAYTALTTKCLSGLITAGVWKAIQQPISYALGVFLGITAALQVMYLNRALKHFDATIVIPVHFVFFTLSVVIGSAITFRDFEDKDGWEISAFFVGCIFTFVGVYVIGGPSSIGAQTNSSAVVHPASNATTSTSVGSPPAPFITTSSAQAYQYHAPILPVHSHHLSAPSPEASPSMSPAFQRANLFLRATSSTLFPSPGEGDLSIRRDELEEEQQESQSLLDEPGSYSGAVVFDEPSVGVPGFLVGTVLHTKTSISRMRENARGNESLMELSRQNTEDRE